ncbi:MAG TPA: hypothetical protein PKN33_20095 [Phycisphaerae bacterium]|nr:hypothetical protein [Phycisphaerae bacterium]
MSGTLRINGHTKWIAMMVGLISLVAAGTYEHTRAVEQLGGIKADVARIERAQAEQGRTLESLKRAVWTLAAARGVSIPSTGGPQP